MFDSGQNGLVSSHEIGLFNSSGVLLTSTTVGDGTSGTLIDQFRYASTSTVNLVAGENYYLGAFFTATDDELIFPPPYQDATVTSLPSLTFLSATYNFGSSLSAPITEIDGAAYFGPNLIASDMSSVPLPASAPMFGAALLALACFGYVVKRKKAVAAV